jgi:hypothetical protein
MKDSAIWMDGWTEKEKRKTKLLMQTLAELKLRHFYTSRYREHHSIPFCIQEP